MFTFDPTIGTGALIRAALLAEMSFNTADNAAEQGHDALADAFWQIGAQISHA
jgi:hypothetical protein